MTDPSPERPAPVEWGASLQKALEASQVVNNRLQAFLHAVHQKLTALPGTIEGGLQSIITEIRDKQDAVRREERRRVALEFMSTYEVCRSSRLEGADPGGMLGAVLGPLVERFSQIALHARQGLQACGLEVRDEGAEFNPQYDTVVKAQPVGDASSDRKVLAVHAPGYIWMDGTGVLRPRHVTVGQFISNQAAQGGPNDQ